MIRKRVWAGVFVSLLTLGLLASVGTAAVGVDSTALRATVSPEALVEHLEVLESIGPRPAGSEGYDLAADWVAGELAAVGYAVEIQEFTFDSWEELSWPALEQLAPRPAVYAPWDYAGFMPMEYSAAGDVTAPLVAAANLGCAASDFAGDFAGKIALVRRGVCYFSDKVQNAEAAGAAAVIIYNDGVGGQDRFDAFYGTLQGVTVAVPVVGTSNAVGLDLLGDGVVAHVLVDAVTTLDVPTANVLATTARGRADRTVVVGAHLDGAPGTTGINDNGSGVATVLEIARQMALQGVVPRNRVVFAFWGAEENGLLGSQHYVDQVVASGRERDIAVTLNFDMIASNTYERFVYDGDGSPTGVAGPHGSGNTEAVFLEYFDAMNLDSAPTEFDGRSDYGPFIDADIAAGGLFAGAEGYDACYHLPCDDLSNLNLQALDELSDAAAHAVLTFAMTTSAVNGTDKASDNAISARGRMPYRGSAAIE